MSDLMWVVQLNVLQCTNNVLLFLGPLLVLLLVLLSRMQIISCLKWRFGIILRPIWMGDWMLFPNSECWLSWGWMFLFFEWLMDYQWRTDCQFWFFLYWLISYDEWYIQFWYVLKWQCIFLFIGLQDGWTWFNVLSFTCLNVQSWSPCSVLSDVCLWNWKMYSTCWIISLLFLEPEMPVCFVAQWYYLLKYYFGDFWLRLNCFGFLELIVSAYVSHSFHTFSCYWRFHSWLCPTCLVLNGWSWSICDTCEWLRELIMLMRCIFCLWNELEGSFSICLPHWLMRIVWNVTCFVFSFFWLTKSLLFMACMELLLLYEDVGMDLSLYCQWLVSIV